MYLFCTYITCEFIGTLNVRKKKTTTNEILIILSVVTFICLLFLHHISLLFHRAKYHLITKDSHDTLFLETIHVDLEWDYQKTNQLK